MEFNADKTEEVIFFAKKQQPFDSSIELGNRFSNSYFINTIYEFNLLDKEIRNSKSISEFERKLLSVIFVGQIVFLIAIL